MEIAPDNVLKNGKVLCYMMHIVKDTRKSVLIEHLDNYFTISFAWERGEVSVYRKIGKWSHTRKFDTTEECNNWWDMYQNILKQARTQIYV